MHITLREITEENWRECIALKPKEQQKGYIPENVYSLAEWKFNPHWIALGIYKESELIGFAMYGVDLSDGSMNLIRFMIDQKHQGKGYGKISLNELLCRIKSTSKCKEIWVGFHPGNSIIKKMYTEFGFRQEITGLEDADEVFYKLECKEVLSE